jgi:hypothetical protein
MGGVMVSVISLANCLFYDIAKIILELMLKANHVVGHGFTLNQIKQDYEIGICNFSAKHAAFRVWIMVV